MMPAVGRKNEYHKRVSPIVRNGGRSRLPHIKMIKLKNTMSPNRVAEKAIRRLSFHADHAPMTHRRTAGRAKYIKWFQVMLTKC